MVEISIMNYRDIASVYQLRSTKCLQRQLILYNGYPEEDHWVTTEDGFILGLQRIPHGKTGPTNGRHTVYIEI